MMMKTTRQQAGRELDDDPCRLLVNDGEFMSRKCHISLIRNWAHKLCLSLTIITRSFFSFARSPSRWSLFSTSVTTTSAKCRIIFYSDPRGGRKRRKTQIHSHNKTLVHSVTHLSWSSLSPSLSLSLSPPKGNLRNVLWFSKTFNTLLLSSHKEDVKDSSSSLLRCVVHKSSPWGWNTS